MTKQILSVTGDGGESYESWFAVHRFQEAVYTTRVAAPSVKRMHLVMHDFEPGWDTYREAPGYGMNSDIAFKDVVVDDYEAIVLIGGRAPEYLRNDPRLVAIVQDFDRKGKWIFSICHGVQILVAADLLRGKNVTCYEHVRIEVEAVGGCWQHADVVREGRIVSSPTWQEHPAFYREVFACLQEPKPHAVGTR
jgi:protease I